MWNMSAYIYVSLYIYIYVYSIYIYTYVHKQRCVRLPHQIVIKWGFRVDHSVPFRFWVYTYIYISRTQSGTCAMYRREVPGKWSMRFVTAAGFQTRILAGTSDSGNCTRCIHIYIYIYICIQLYMWVYHTIYIYYICSHSPIPYTLWWAIPPHLAIIISNETSYT